VASIVSVYYASNQYQRLSRCINAAQVRSWIRGANRRDPNTEFPSVAAVLTVSAPTTLLSASVYAFLVGFGVYLAYAWTLDFDALATQDDSKAVFITYVVGVFVCFSVYGLSSAAVGANIDGEVWTRDRVGRNSDGNHASADPEAPPEAPPEAEPPQTGNLTDTNRNSQLIEKPLTVPGAGGVRPMGDLDLVQALREAARLRRELAGLDNRIAELMERQVPSST